MLGFVIFSAMTFAVFPVFNASTVHTTIESNIDDQDQIVTFTFRDTDSGGGDVFFTPSITNGWSGKVNLFFCDDSVNPNAYSIKADTDGNNSAETTVVTIDPTAAGCFSSDATLPAGTDRLAFNNADAEPNMAVVTLHLDSSPELP